jgi:O-antigen/teichoic acid export membrane protein
VRKYLKSEFIQSVMVLMTGTVLAQLVSYLISPLLTRIYTPDEMGELNVYLRAVSFIAALATARFEIALPLPKTDAHSYLLYRLSTRIAAFTLLGISLVLLAYTAFNGFNWDEVFFFAVVVVSSGFLVMINLGTNWSIRKKLFKKISTSRIVNSFTANGLRWGFGVWGFGAKGLLVASLIGSVLSSLVFIKDWANIRKKFDFFKSPAKTKVLLTTYREFPIINLPHVMVDLGKDLLIATLIIAYFGKGVFGLFSHSYAILQLPVAFIGLSISQVFMNRCAELVNQGESTLGLTKKTVSGLFLFSVLPFSLIFFFGEPLFELVFGATWGRAGYYSQIMTSWLMINFLTSAISTLPSILNRQREFFVLGMISGSIQLLCFGVLPLFFERNEETFVLVLKTVSISQTIFLLLLMWRMIQHARMGPKIR